MTRAPDRPGFDLLKTLSTRPPDSIEADVEQILGRAYQVEGKASLLGGERDRNFLVTAGRNRLLVKIANSAEPDDLLEFQCAALRHVELVDPDLPVPRLISTTRGRDWAEMSGHNGSVYRVRVFEYLPGLPLSEAVPDPGVMRNLGGVQARLTRALRGFYHPGADHPLAWDLKRFDGLHELLPLIKDNAIADLVAYYEERFTRLVKPSLPRLRSQVIHNDMSFHNVVIDRDTRSQITGLFDFGDMVQAPLIQDLAVSAAEVPVGVGGSLDLGSHIVAGFHSVVPLEEEEISLLVDMVPARLAMGLMIGAWTTASIEWSDDRAHLDNWDTNVVAMLKRLQQEGAAKIEGSFRKACGLSAKVFSVGGTPDFDSVWARRMKLLGNAEVASYKRPLHLVQGKGAWLYDADGKAYLDAYNNVPHVGHCHPRVVRAVAEQTATLNTNTRYVYESVLNYADRLTSMLPEGLDVCFFVSSGSEANDLAWRLAKSSTGNNGGVVVDEAYHGVTEATWDLSPSERDEGCPDHIATVTAPDEYRGQWRRDIPDRGHRYATLFRPALTGLAERGYAPAAFFIDMILSSSGIFVPPPGYLRHAFDQVRNAGGICVADEVQSGFGRTGKQMWGFQVDDVIPDVVTLGKPVAGGYPMGVVITSREIAHRFEEDGEFFSTTGGNPVACAAALAVLDVLAEEQLMAQADRVGRELMTGIEALAEKFELIGDVRGSGLFIGVELVKDRTTLEPASSEASMVANAMKEDGVLIGTSGPLENVLKIRPPLVFSSSDADLLLKVLSGALGAVTATNIK